MEVTILATALSGQLASFEKEPKDLFFVHNGVTLDAVLTASFSTRTDGAESSPRFEEADFHSVISLKLRKSVCVLPYILRSETSTAYWCGLTPFSSLSTSPRLFPYVHSFKAQPCIQSLERRGKSMYYLIYPRIPLASPVLGHS
jgi:hypothetical protein